MVHYTEGGDQQPRGHCHQGVAPPELIDNFAVVAPQLKTALRLQGLGLSKQS